MKFQMTAKSIAIVALGVSLIACGGGGGGDDAQSTPAPALSSKALGAAFVAQRLKVNALGTDSKSMLSSKALIQCAEGGQMTIEESSTADNREIRTWQIDSCRLDGRTASGRVRMIGQCPNKAITDCEEVTVHYGENGVAWSITQDDLTQYITGRIEQTRQANKVVRLDLRRQAFQVAGVNGRSVVESDVQVTKASNGKVSLDGELNLNLVSNACFDGRYTVATTAPVDSGGVGFKVELLNAANDAISATRSDKGWDVVIDGAETVFVSDSDAQACL